MPREIRAPKEIASRADGDAVVDYARCVAAIVSRYTRRTEREVLEALMRVVGHLCATGGGAR